MDIFGIKLQNVSFLLTPLKINMEPTNHPFRKENDLPNLDDCHGRGRHLKLHARSSRIPQIFQSTKLCLQIAVATPCPCMLGAYTDLQPKVHDKMSEVADGGWWVLILGSNVYLRINGASTLDKYRFFTHINLRYATCICRGDVKPAKSCNHILVVIWYMM